MLGAGVANTILASEFCSRKQAGHLIASDQFRSLLRSYKWGPSTSAIWSKLPMPCEPDKLQPVRVHGPATGGDDTAMMIRPVRISRTPAPRP